MMKFAGYKPLLSAIFGNLLSLALATGPASAAIIVLNSGDIIPGTVWSVSFPASVTLSFNDADTTNGTAGTLIESTSRMKNDPITLLFQQMFETPTSTPARAGLRLNFQKTDTNAVGPDWNGYNLQLFDDFPLIGEDPLRSTDHPPEPHFHPAAPIATTPATFIFGETFTGNQTDKYASSFKGDATSRDFPDLIQLGFNADGTPNGKTVIKGRSVQIANLLIHERQFAPGLIGDPGRRTFRLVETPIIPEPGSLGLCGIALTMLGSYSWLWRRRRAA